MTDLAERVQRAVAAREAEFAERVGQLRADAGGEPLVSRAAGPTPIDIGCVVTQRVPDLANHFGVTGRVVERFVNDDDIDCVVLIEVWRDQVRHHTLRVEDIDQSWVDAVRPADPFSCVKAARELWAVLGKSNASTLTMKDRRYLFWISVLLRAGRNE